jgi:hypothetical protein
MSGSHEWRDIPRSHVSITGPRDGPFAVRLSKASDADASAPVVSYRVAPERVPDSSAVNVRIEVETNDREDATPRLNEAQTRIAELLEEELRGKGPRPSSEVIDTIREAVGASPSVIKKVRDKLKAKIAFERDPQTKNTVWEWVAS